jgi:hypothetical protein
MQGDSVEVWNMPGGGAAGGWVLNAVASGTDVAATQFKFYEDELWVRIESEGEEPIDGWIREKEIGIQQETAGVAREGTTGDRSFEPSSAPGADRDRPRWHARANFFYPEFSSKEISDEYKNSCWGAGVETGLFLTRSINVGVLFDYVHANGAPLYKYIGGTLTDWPLASDLDVLHFGARFGQLLRLNAWYFEYGVGPAVFHVKESASIAVYDGLIRQARERTSSPRGNSARPAGSEPAGSPAGSFPWDFPSDFHGYPGKAKGRNPSRSITSRTTAFSWSTWVSASAIYPSDAAPRARETYATRHRISRHGDRRPRVRGLLGLSPISVRIARSGERRLSRFGFDPLLPEIHQRPPARPMRVRAELLPIRPRCDRRARRFQGSGSRRRQARAVPRRRTRVLRDELEGKARGLGPRTIRRRATSGNPRVVASVARRGVRDRRRLGER